MSYIPIAGTISPWIPCSERLPEVRQLVLVFIPEIANPDEQYKVTRYTGAHPFPWNLHHDYWHYDVTDWMPLPTAPVPAEVITA